MKRNIKKRISLILLFAVIAASLFSVFAVSSGASDSAVDSTAVGRTFTSSDELSMTRHLKAQPMTYKALINVPAGASTRGVIFGNYRESGISCLNFEITAAGNPSLYFIDSNKVETRIEFDYDVRGLGWIDLAITHTVLETGSEFTCYINGESIGVIASDLSCKISLASCQRLYPFALGHDWYSSKYYFKGSIQNVAIFDKALTSVEISSIYSDGVNLSDASLLAYYDLNKAENNTGTKVSDSTSGAHDFERLFQDTRRDFDYAYSFAVVGDTQHLVYRDAHYGTDWTSAIYDWIVLNKESKNIKFVMGLGDITDKNGKDNLDDGIDKTDVEWIIAVDQLNKLYGANIPYSLVSGNHDTVAQLDKFFKNNANFKDADISYYSGDSLGNYCIKFSVDATKYMVVALDYGANDNILAWAGNEIASNPDHRVIITTHAFMCADGTTLEATDSTSVPRPTNPNATEKDRNNGDDMWHELASRYENVILVLSGHISAADVVYRKDFGDNGNTVYQMLINFQTMDTKYSRETGMIAMFYFSEDGKVVNVEYVSAYKSLEAQEKDATAPDVVYRPAVNSFGFEYPDSRAEGEETKYGIISPAYLDKELYPVVVFKSDKTFVGGFYELNHAMESLVSVYNDKNGSYIMYFRTDSVNTGDVVNFGSFDGELVIDLNGTTVRNTTNYMINCTFSGDSGNSPSITIKNGTFVKDANTLGLIKFDYSATLTENAYCDIIFENVTFRSLVNYNKNTSVAFITYEGGYDSATAEVRVNATFNDCTFDYVNSISGAVMIPMKHYYKGNVKDRVIFDVTVNGGSAIYTSASAFTSYFTLSNDNTNGRADTIKYGRNSEGSYIKLILPVGNAAPGTGFAGVDGESCVFNEISATEENVTYTLINADALKTKYGTISTEYENPQLYPVVVFKKTTTGYTFVGGYATFDEATGGPASKDANATGLRTVSGWYKSEFVILLRDDAKSMDYANFNAAYGTYLVDLNGHTLTNSGDSYLFRVNHTVTGKDPSVVNKWCTINVINGTLLNKANVVLFSTDYGKNNTRSYSVSYNFDNVIFKTTNDKWGIFGNWETGASSIAQDSAMKVEVSSVFNNCTFDYTGAGSELIMISMVDTDNHDRIIFNVEINGGTIIANKTFNKAHFMAADANTNGRGDVLKFGKNADGEYTTLVLPADIAAPDAGEVYLNTADTECIFAKAYESNGKVVYRIRPSATVGISFIPKMSLSLDRNLIMNIYVPKELLVKFSFDNVEYENPAEVGFETEILDGKEYYLIKVSLPASEAARVIKLKATVDIGEKTATATFSFSIPKYAEKVIASGTDVEKQLVKDVLSYIRAAYVFIGSDDTDAIARINEILGESYDSENMPAIEGGSAAIGEGIKSVTFHLDGEPSMRFRLENGFDVSRFKFYIDGKEVNIESETDGDGVYVDIDVYAYALCETVSYTLDGEAGGSYHINNYYSFVKNEYTGENKDKLTSLTERFWKYLQSSRAYRASVLDNEKAASGAEN